MKICIVTGSRAEFYILKNLIKKIQNIKYFKHHLIVTGSHTSKFFGNTIKKIKDEKIKIDNQEIKEILTVNGIRFSFKDGSWGLIRASSNKPSLVIVTESSTSNERKIKIFRFIDKLLQETKKIGEYDQKI